MQCRESVIYCGPFDRTKNLGPYENVRARIVRKGRKSTLQIYLSSFRRLAKPRCAIAEEVCRSIQDAKAKMREFASQTIETPFVPIWYAFTYDIYRTGGHPKMYVLVKQFYGDATWYWFTTFFQVRYDDRNVVDTITFGANIEEDPESHKMVKYVGCRSRQAALKEALEHIRTTDNEDVKAELEKWKYAIHPNIRMKVMEV